MVWPQHIERWRKWVNWESRDIPTDLVLSIIAHESGGKAGIKSHANTRAAELPTDPDGDHNGQPIRVNNAMGLMQVIPPNVASWNENKTPKITYEDMTEGDERAVRLQIRIGSSIFASYVHRLHVFDPVTFPGTSPGTATPEQLRLALVCYAVGPGRPGGQKGLIPKLEILKRQGKPLTLAALRANFPRWGYSESQGRWINRPLKASTVVWSNYKKHSKNSVKKPSPTSILPSKPDGKKGWLDGWLLPAALLAAILFFERKGLERLFK